MTSELHLNAVRGVLIRLEETIIFGLIERAQHPRNLVIYVRGGVGRELGEESLVGYMLRECECSHAKVRRYTSPDEHPFFTGLPEPILPPLRYPDNPLHRNSVNLNPKIRAAYESEIVPFICRPGDDRQYGSSAVNDVSLLQTLSKRIHYGKFVAEIKYRGQPDSFAAPIRARDEAALEALVTAADVEAAILERVRRKAATYGGELAAAGHYTVAPDVVAGVYARWIIPLCRQVEVAYLLQRLE